MLGHSMTELVDAQIVYRQYDISFLLLPVYDQLKMKILYILLYFHLIYQLNIYSQTKLIFVLKFLKLL